MKKIMMTLAAVLCCAMATTVFTACNNDEDIKPAGMYGDWVSFVLRTDGSAVFETDYFNGSNVTATTYQLYGSNMIQNGLIIESNVTNIVKSVTYGTFSYQGDKLSVTWPTGIVSGTVKFKENGAQCIWSTNYIDLEMVRPNAETNSYKAQIERIYQSKYAK
jgi:hypothetical protein